MMDESAAQQHQQPDAGDASPPTKRQRVSEACDIVPRMPMTLTSRKGGPCRSRSMPVSFPTSDGTHTHAHTHTHTHTRTHTHTAELTPEVETRCDGRQPVCIACKAHPASGARCMAAMAIVAATDYRIPKAKREACQQRAITTVSRTADGQALH
ncbi:hypothetical protein AC579_3121 [Pseudocercospora musae]|uniref:Uncharacterized protein n=1 Tax=Pseudocercospora musae TaxID=113226 RepID=A0A139IAA2_9PEZI|nr:hypothetical protein AC579_3121 [Pseudocercospora musae]